MNNPTTKKEFSSSSEQEVFQSYEKAGKIVSKVRNEASKLINDGLAIIELVEFVESKIIKEGGGIAFPCNVSVNEITAHYTSPPNDKNIINGGDLVKLDLGAEVNGYIADSAITIIAKGDSDLSDDETNKNESLIEASDAALDVAISTVKAGVEVKDIGGEVEKTITGLGFSPIRNLAGHSLEQWDLHSGLSIPNVKDNRAGKLEEGDVIAIEPFVTNGVGYVVDVPAVNIFKFLKNRSFRLQYTKKVLNHIRRNYPNLPFSFRWLTEEFNSNRLNSSIKELSDSMAIYPYNILREKSGAWVAQKEHTLIVEKEGCHITTV
ncbi:MAG: type II methionyl aminopeptidase [Methanobrevibacter sp.]|jgi:methionyl aminopeptidase|nr:type II methionyl aminopeptidase [Candidatus Methanovirga meridionalis]